MTVYHFDPVTLLYTGSSDAHIGPKGDMQLPAFSSLVSPGDIPIGKVAQAQSVSDGTAAGWRLVDDHRDEAIFLTSDGSRYEFGAPLLGVAGWNGLGDIPDGLTTMEKPSGSYSWSGNGWVFDLNLARSAALAAVNAKLVEVLSAPFTYNGQQFAADPASLSQWAAKASLAAVAKQTGQSYMTVCVAIDGSVVELDADGMIALAMAAAAREPAAHKTAQQLRAQIAVADTQAMLGGVTWPA